MFSSHIWPLEKFSSLEQGSLKSVKGTRENMQLMLYSVVMSWTRSLWRVDDASIPFYCRACKWNGGKKINVSRHKKEEQTLPLDAIFICGFQGVRLQHEQGVCCKPTHKSQLLFDTWWLGKLKRRDISFFVILSNTKIFNSKLNHNWDFCFWHCRAAKQKKGTWLQTEEKYIQYDWRKLNS